MVTRFKKKDGTYFQLDHPKMHADPGTAKAQIVVAQYAWAARVQLGIDAFSGPVQCIATALFLVPQSWTKARKEAACWHTSKPDSTNIAKLIEDACNPPHDPNSRWIAKLAASAEPAAKGILWTDDALVSLSAVRKLWAHVEGVLVTVTELRPGVPDVLRDAGAPQSLEWRLEPFVAKLAGMEPQVALGESSRYADAP
jgi:Holliday junction resolvase RusA-like endonuclease